ncbi:MAG: zinc transporter, family [Thermoleophilaceae bacterium]|nr:zinc transporter, family [Thermoleophilaceae bacterium]
MATVGAPRRSRRGWLAGIVPLAVLAGAVLALSALHAPGLARRGVPVERLVVDRTTLRPGLIELHVRNDGPDGVGIRQVIVNDGFAPFTQDTKRVGRLGANTVKVSYPWIKGEAYEIKLLSSTGNTATHRIDVAAESPAAGASLFGVMSLIGLYVGIIPVAIGMLWLPWLRRLDPRWIRFALAATVGLLAFIGLQALREGQDIGAKGAQALGGAGLVFVGAGAAYLTLAGIDSWLRARRERARAAGPVGSAGAALALLIAIGIGLHNLGEGLAIGSAYAIGSLALGVSLVVGFAIHNTTEGLAIVAPAAGEQIPLRRLALLGAVAGLPVIPGALIGAAAYDTSLTALMLGIGAGAIAQVIVQISPALREKRGGALLNPLSVAGVLAGLAVMYVTNLLISV